MFQFFNKSDHKIILNTCILVIYTSTVLLRIIAGQAIRTKQNGFSSHPSNTNDEDFDLENWHPKPFHEIVSTHFGQAHHYHCEPISLPLCKGMYYETTRMPNMFQHETQEEAGLEVHQYYALVQINCSEDLRFLLCSIYTPICMEGYPTFLPPCRSLCERVKTGCFPVMKHYNLPWPERLNCSQFPEYNNPEQVLCMERNLSTSQMRETTETTMKTRLPSTFVPFKTANTKLHVEKSKSGSEQEESRQIVTRSYALNEEAQKLFTHIERENATKRRVLDKNPDVRMKCVCGCPDQLDREDDKVIVENPSECTIPCAPDHKYNAIFHFSTHFTNFWLAIWAILCCISTFFTIFTYFMDKHRFPYPELPAIYMSASYFMVSVGYLLRVIIGYSAIACDTMATKTFIHIPPSSPTSTTTTSSGRAGCAVVFILIYFFRIAAGGWWVVLTLTWFLTAAMKWGSESIAKYSHVFHFIGWSIPTGLSALTLLRSVVQRDLISGLCSISPSKQLAYVLFQLTPSITFLTLGCGLLLSGFVAIYRIRGMIRLQRLNSNKTDRLDNLMFRIGLFGLFYSISSIIIMICELDELNHNRERELGMICDCYYTDVTIPSRKWDGLQWERPKPDYGLFMLKHSMLLVVGVICGLWICSFETVTNWKRLCQFWCKTKQKFENGTTRLLPSHHCANLPSERIKTIHENLNGVSFQSIMKNSNQGSNNDFASRKFFVPSVQYDMGTNDLSPYVEYGQDVNGGYAVVTDNHAHPISIDCTASTSLSNENSSHLLASSNRIHLKNYQQTWCPGTSWPRSGVDNGNRIYPSIQDPPPSYPASVETELSDYWINSQPEKYQMNNLTFSTRQSNIMSKEQIKRSEIIVKGHSSSIPNDKSFNNHPESRFNLSESDKTTMNIPQIVSVSQMNPLLSSQSDPHALHQNTHLTTD